MEMSLASVQREDAKAQSSLDLKKQNLKDETKKRKELVKSMEEVMDSFVLLIGGCKIFTLSSLLVSVILFRTRKCSW